MVSDFQPPELGEAPATCTLLPRPREVQTGEYMCSLVSAKLVAKNGV